MIDPQLLKILVCPKCKGNLEYDRENEKLLCQACRLGFRIENDIPVMLVDEAEPFSE
jgi:uncharacterized protein YbaR (Trm112 family)